MKIKLENDSYYDGIKTFEMNDVKGGDFALIMEYLNVYSTDLQQKIKMSDNSIDYPKIIIWQAKIDKIKCLSEKYNKLIEFIQYVDEDETAL